MYDFLLFLDITGDLLALSELEMGGPGERVLGSG